MTSDPAAAAAQPEPGHGALTGDSGDRVPVRRDTLEAIAKTLAGGHAHDERLRAAAYRQGRDTHLTGGYQAGFALGHDTGYSARQDTRGYVHGILDGFAADTQARHQLADDLLRRDEARRAAARQGDREAEPS